MITRITRDFTASAIPAITAVRVSRTSVPYGLLQADRRPPGLHVRLPGPMPAEETDPPSADPNVLPAVRPRKRPDVADREPCAVLPILNAGPTTGKLPKGNVP